MASRFLLVLGVCAASLATGCGGDDEKSDNTPPPPATDPSIVDVNGVVVSTLGYALPGISVKVWSANAAAPVEVVTDAVGTFAAGAMTKPYDVSVIEPETGAVYLYVALSTASPSIVLTHYDKSTTSTRFGAYFDASGAPGGAKTQGLLETAQGAITNRIEADQAGYGFTAYAPADVTSVAATYRALRWMTSASRLAYYLGYTEQPVTASQDTPAGTTTLAPISSRQLTVRGRLGGGASARIGRLIWRSAAPAKIDEDNFINGVVTFEVPSDARIPMAIEILGFNESAVFRTVDTSIATMDATAPDPIAWASPVEGAAYDDTSVFTVTTVEDAAYEVSFVGSGGTTYVIGTSPTFTASLLRSRGASLLPGSYQTNAEAFVGAGEPVSGERLTLSGRYAHDGSVNRRTGALTVTVP